MKLYNNLVSNECISKIKLVLPVPKTLVHEHMEANHLREIAQGVDTDSYHVELVSIDSMDYNRQTIAELDTSRLKAFAITLTHPRYSWNFEPERRECPIDFFFDVELNEELSNARNFLIDQIRVDKQKDELEYRPKVMLRQNISHEWDEYAHAYANPESAEIARFLADRIEVRNYENEDKYQILHSITLDDRLPLFAHDN